MTFEVEFTDLSRKQIKKLDNKTQERIISALERIRIRPQSYVTRLVAEPGYRLRVGDYRVIIDIIDDKLIILVIKIGHRKNVYDR